MNEKGKKREEKMSMTEDEGEKATLLPYTIVWHVDSSEDFFGKASW